MQKEYKRNASNSVFWIIIGLLVGLSSLKDGTFVPLYDGLRIAVGLASILIGIWGFITPIVTISDKELTIKMSIDKKKKYNKTRVNVQIDENTSSVSFSEDGKVFVFQLKNLKKTDKEQFMEEIKKLIKE